MVIRGKNTYPTEASFVENACKHGWLHTEEAAASQKFEEIDIGESAVISLAQKKSIKTVLIDDAAGRKIAEAFGLRVRGTLFIIIEAYRRKKITGNEAEELIHKLVSNGFRVSSEIYAQCLREFEKVK